METELVHSTWRLGSACRGLPDSSRNCLGLKAGTYSVLSELADLALLYAAGS